MQAEPVLRTVRREDLPAVLTLYADDEFSRGREGGEAAASDPAILQAFADVEADPNSTLYVLEQDGRIIGTAQLTVIAGLSRGGAKRALVEAVRIASTERNSGLGRLLMEKLHAVARERGCGLVQLSSDKRRVDAHRFYRALGYGQSHDGFKLPLD